MSWPDIHSCVVRGMDVLPVEVKVTIDPQGPDATVESGASEPVAFAQYAKKAFAGSGFAWPSGTVTVSYEPNGLVCSSDANLELAVAVAVTQASGQTDLLASRMLLFSGPLRYRDRLNSLPAPPRAHDKGAYLIAEYAKEEGLLPVFCSHDARRCCDIGPCAHLEVFHKDLLATRALPVVYEDNFPTPYVWEAPRPEAHPGWVDEGIARKMAALLLCGCPPTILLWDKDRPEGRRIADFMASILTDSRLLPEHGEATHHDARRVRSAAGQDIYSAQYHVPIVVPATATRSELFGDGRALAPGLASLATGTILALDGLERFDPKDVQRLTEAIEMGEIELGGAEATHRFPMKPKLMAYCESQRVNSLRTNAVEPWKRLPSDWLSLNACRFDYFLDASDGGFVTRRDPASSWGVSAYELKAMVYAGREILADSLDPGALERPETLTLAECLAAVDGDLGFGHLSQCAKEAREMSAERVDLAACRNLAESDSGPLDETRLFGCDLPPASDMMRTAEER